MGFKTRSLGRVIALLSVVALSACTVGDEQDSAQTSSSNAVVEIAEELVETSQEVAQLDAPASEVEQIDIPASEITQPQGLEAETDTFLFDVESLVVPHGAIAIHKVGEAHQPDFSVPAWSTIKVPIAIAALREDPDVINDVEIAIRASDNEAIKRLWASLDDPVAQVTAVIEEAGSSAYVLDRRLVPPYTSYGQSPWTVPEQANFAAGLRCVEGSEEVVDFMSNITVGGDYGLGIIPGAILKSGWGPSPEGIYGLRQLGLVPNGDGYVAVALAATSPDGSYASGQAILTEMATNLQQVLEQLPADAC